jgi:hypothetical protein
VPQRSTHGFDDQRSSFIHLIEYSVHLTFCPISQVSSRYMAISPNLSSLEPAMIVMRMSDRGKIGCSRTARDLWLHSVWVFLGPRNPPRPHPSLPILKVSTSAAPRNPHSVQNDATTHLCGFWKNSADEWMDWDQRFGWHR